MRLVELRQLKAILESLADSTDVVVTANNVQLEVSGRNSPYVSRTEVVYSATHDFGPFDSVPWRGQRKRGVWCIQNRKYVLLVGVDVEVEKEHCCDHLEVVFATVPRLPLARVLNSIPGVEALGIELEMMETVAWFRPQLVGWWAPDEPILAAELQGDLESLRGHRMTHLRFRDDRPVITLPDETRFEVFAYSIVNFHVLAYGENEGEKTVALIPVEGLDTVELHRANPYDPEGAYDSLATWRGFEAHLRLSEIRTWPA